MKIEFETKAKAILGDYSYGLTDILKQQKLDRSSVHYGDFADISDDELLLFVKKRGWGNSGVSELDSDRIDPASAYSISKVNSDVYKVYSIGDRGNNELIGTFVDIDSARQRVLQEKRKTAVSFLSAAYRDSHFPGATIPMPGQPWPDGKVRY